jgi:hypothetical protein
VILWRPFCRSAKIAVFHIAADPIRLYPDGRKVDSFAASPHAVKSACAVKKKFPDCFAGSGYIFPKASV